MNEEETNMKFRGKGKIAKAVIAIAFFLSLFLLVETIAEIKTIGTIGEGIVPQNTITVSGTGDAYAIPDIATVDFDVTAEAATVSAAQSTVTSQTNTILASLESAGIASADVKTTNYTISPHYVYTNQSTICPAGAPCYYPPSNQTLTGYDVTDSVEVTIRDTSKAGTILADLGTAKVSNLSSLNFTVDNPDSVEAQARGLAITDAKSKAQTLASQLGVSLGRIVSYSEQGSSPIYYPLNAAAGAVSASSAPAPEVPAGQNKVTSNVSITYEID